MPYKDKKAQTEYQKRWVQWRRAEWLAANGPCVKCGSWYNLEVDHIDRNTKVSHKIWSWTSLRREEELAKCQVLCRDCHKTKTATENNKPITHGLKGSYTSRGCRCSLCWEASKAYNREWHRKRLSNSTGRVPAL